MFKDVPNIKKRLKACKNLQPFFFTRFPAAKAANGNAGLLFPGLFSACQPFLFMLY